ncbi:MAG: hypothetical protein JNN07_25165 [Verrucomicrobiales bacterium]|nr:hypothetical protein [Verrucomicrobiales bacterium]
MKTVNSPASSFPERTRLSLFLAFIGLSLLSGSADTITWTNVAGGTWGRATHWSPGRVPTIADDVLITTPGTYTITQDVHSVAASLTLGAATGSQTLVANGRSLTVAQTLLIGANGVLTENNNLTSAVARVEGRLNWTGGTLVGPLGRTGLVDVAVGGLVTMTNNAGRTLTRMGVTNGGRILWTQGSLTSSGGNMEFWNLNQFEIGPNSPATASWAPSAATITSFLHNTVSGRVLKTGSAAARLDARLINEGTIEVQAGTLEFSDGGTNSGPIAINAGTTLQISAGVFDFVGGQLTGDGTNLISGTARVRYLAGAQFGAGSYLLDVAGGSLDFETGAAPTVNSLRVRGGVLGGSDTLEINGRFTWNGGSFEDLTLITHGGLFITPTAGVALSWRGGRIDNWGNGAWTNGSIQTISQGTQATLSNHGRLDFMQGVNWNDSGNPGARIVNEGLIRLPESTQATSLGVFLENRPSGTLHVTNTDLTLSKGGYNEGRVEVAGTGSMKLTATSVPFELRPGSQLVGNGLLQINGLLKCFSGVEVGDPLMHLRLNSGQLLLNQDCTFSAGEVELVAGSVAGPGQLVAHGETHWQQGDLRTNVFLNCLGGLTIDSPTTAPHSFSAGIVRNAGVAHWSAGLTQTTPGPSIITNDAGGTFQMDDGVRWSSPGNTPNRLVNEGTFTRNPGAGTVQIEGHFDNAGTNVLRGSLSLKPNVGVYHQTAGRTVFEGGGSLRADGGTQIDGGTFDGNGEIDSAVTNGGTIRPGASPGLLHLLRQFVQLPSGNLEVELTGTAVDQFDRLLVDGSAALDGLVSVSFLGGFTPQPSDTFKFLTATGGRTGAFADLAAPAGPPWLALGELADGAQLSVITGPPQLSISLPFPSTTLTAEQSVDIDVSLSFPGGNVANVSLTAISGDQSIVPNANITFTGTGRVRVMRIRPNVGSSGSTVVTVTATGEGGRTASASLNLVVLPAPPQGMLVYEPFDYTPAAGPLSLKAGGFGFSGPWGAASGFTLDSGSLPYPNMQQAGHHAKVPSQPISAQTIARRLSTPLGTPGTVRYLSFLARPAGTLGAGGGNGYFGLLADASVGLDLFVGKPGGGDFNHWVVEDAGGARQVTSSQPALVGTAAWLVIKLEFFPGNDRISLFVNPIPGQPEPVTPNALRTDRDLGEIAGLALTSTGAWAIDELRVGTTWTSATPDSAYLVPLALQSVGTLKATEGTALRFTPSLQSVVTPRQPIFELVASPPGMTIDANTGALFWLPDERSGGTLPAVTVRVHDEPLPSTGQAEVTFQVDVQEANSPPGLNLASNASLEVAPGTPYRLQLGFIDSDLPANTVVFALTPNTGPVGLTVSPDGLLEWTPPVDAPLGPLTVRVRLTDFNPSAPASSQHLTTDARFDLTIVKPNADLAVRHVLAPRTVAQGQTAQFQFEIENRGPSIANQSQFTFQSPEFLGNPARLALVSAFNNRGTYQLQGDKLICDLGNLGVGEKAGVLIELRFLSDSTTSFMTSAKSSLVDFNLSNNGDAGTVEVAEPPPQNPTQWQFTKIEELGDTGYGACLATDRKGLPHSIWFNRSQRQIHYGTWDGLRWTGRLLNAPFSPQSASPSTVSADISTPLSMAVDENYRVHVAGAIQRSDLSRALVYSTPNRDNDPAAEWVVEEVFPGPVFSPILHIGPGTSPSRDIWFVAAGTLNRATRGASAVASWGTETFRLPDGWKVSSFGTTIAPVEGEQVFLAGERPDGTVALLLFDVHSSQLQVLDELAKRSDRPIHISAKSIQESTAAAYTRYPVEDGLPEIAYVHQQPSGWKIELVNPQDRCSRPSLSVDQQGAPLVAFTCTEQTANFTVFEDQDRFYRRLWYTARFDGSVWALNRIYETEEITVGLTLEQKRIPLDHPIDPALALGNSLDGSPMIVFHTGWPNENVVFGTLAPRWTPMPTVATLGEGVNVAPVLSLDSSSLPHVAWSDSHQTATDILNHKWLLPGFAYGASPPQILRGAIHRDGLLHTRSGELLALVTDPLSDREAKALRWTTGVTPWMDDALPPGLRGAGDGKVGLVELVNEGSSISVPLQIALGFDDQNRPTTYDTTSFSSWLAARTANTVSPNPGLPPVTATFAAGIGRFETPAAYVAYVVKDQTFRIRVARFEGFVWREDQEILQVNDTLPPLIDLMWTDHPPYDDISNLGYLYLAYTLPAPNGQRSVAIARRHLTKLNTEPWEFISLANLPPSYIQSLRLKGVEESLRLAVFGAGRALLVSSEGILDTNKLGHAAVERLPISGTPVNVDMAMTDSRVWLTYQNQDRVELVGSGGFITFSGNEIPRSPGLVPPIISLGASCENHEDDADCYTCFFLIKAFANRWVSGLPSPNSPAPPPLIKTLSHSSPVDDTSINMVPSFYRIRDLMNQTSEGKRLVDLYYRFEGTARQIANRNPVLYVRSYQMSLNYLPALAAWLAGRGSEVTITREMIEQLNSLWDTFAALGDADLKAALLSERARFHGFDDFIGKNMDDWAALLQIPSTAPNRLQILKAAFGGDGFFVTLTPQPGSNYTLVRKSDVEGATWTRVANQSQRTVADQLVLNDPQPPNGRAFYRVEAAPELPNLK